MCVHVRVCVHTHTHTHIFQFFGDSLILSPIEHVNQLTSMSNNFNIWITCDTLSIVCFSFFGFVSWYAW